MTDETRQPMFVIKPAHIGIALVLQFTVILVTIGSFYGVMRTQIDDDRVTISGLQQSRDDENKALTDVRTSLAQLQGKVDALLDRTAAADLPPH